MPNSKEDLLQEFREDPTWLLKELLFNYANETDTKTQLAYLKEIKDVALSQGEGYSKIVFYLNGVSMDNI